MLKITDAGTVAVGSRRAGDVQIVDLRNVKGHESSAVVKPRLLLEAPQRRIPQHDRRAVGRFLNHLGHLLDAAAVALPLFVYGLVANPSMTRPASLGVSALFVVVVTVALWTTHRRGRHLIGPSEGLASITTRVALAPVVTWALLTVVMAFSPDEAGRFTAGRFIDVVAIIQITVFIVPLVLLGRLISYRLSNKARSRGYDLEDVLILGAGPTGVEIAEALEANPQSGLVPCGFVDRFEHNGPLPVVGRPENLPQILEVTGIRNVVIAFGATSEPELVSIVRQCNGIDVEFRMVPRLFELGVSAEQVGHELDGLPLVKVECPGQSAMRPAKRTLDLVVACILLVLTSPILVACAAAVKLTSRGPVFFRQVRVGVGGRPFEILKFRTMRVNEDSDTQWSADDDDRVTRVGSVLRPSHLDELPQLLNVIRGDMSLVGPRPERPHFVEQFAAEIEGYEHRHRVPVGITGWAQVNGYWGDSSIERRVRLDNRYIENWSMWRDLVIALRTFPTLLGKRR